MVDQPKGLRYDYRLDGRLSGLYLAASTLLWSGCCPIAIAVGCIRRGRHYCSITALVLFILIVVITAGFWQRLITPLHNTSSRTMKNVPRHVRVRIRSTIPAMIGAVVEGVDKTVARNIDRRLKMGALLRRFQAKRRCSVQ